MNNIYSTVILAATLTASSLATATTLPVGGDFTSGNTYGWVNGATGSLTFANNAMEVNNGYHAALQFDAITLAVGETLTATFTFTTPDSTSGFETANGFRVALLNTSTTLTANSNPNLADVTGYMFAENNLVGTSNTASGVYLFSRNTTAGPTINSATPYSVVSGSNSAFSGGLGASQDYTYTVTMTNSGEGNLTVTSLLTGGNITATTQTWEIANGVMTYNTFAIGATATAFQPLSVSSFSIAVVPEPSEVALGLGGIVLLAVLLRRRRSVK